SMEGLYRSNGFQDVKVDADILDNYLGRVGDIAVHFVVNEGIQTRVASLQIEGNHALADEDLQGVVASLPGQPYSDTNVGSDRANILALYFNEGYPEATMRPSVEDVPARSDASGTQQNAAGKSVKSKETAAYKEVKVTYHVEEGPQTR